MDSLKKEKYFYIICNHLLCHYFFDGKLIRCIAERLCHHFVFVFFVERAMKKEEEEEKEEI